MPAIEPLAPSPRDAATFLAISKRTVFRLIRKRKLKVRKCGPRTLIDVASLRTYFASLPSGN
jgi:excisionase family DNA binding protein